MDGRRLSRAGGAEFCDPIHFSGIRVNVEVRQKPRHIMLPSIVLLHIPYIFITAGCATRDR